MIASDPSAALRIRAGARFSFQTSAPTAAVFIIGPDPGAATVLEERWDLEPTARSHEYLDVYGNRCRRMVLPAGTSDLAYDVLVDIPDELDAYAPSAPEVPAAGLPDNALLYTLASRFCPSDEMFAPAIERFGSLPPGWGRVQAIVDFCHDHLTFGYGSSTPTTTAADVLASGRGVCRDFAHLAIALCRALNIPARYAFGYLPDIDVPPPGPMDFCAWFEAYLGDRWYIFDPRNNERRRGRVTIARGRDALDVAMVTTYGAASLRSMTVIADRADDARPEV